MKRKERAEQTPFEKARQKIGLCLYNIKVAVYSAFTKNRKPKIKKKPSNRRLKDGIFVYLVLLFPLAQFCVFYIGVNINSIIMTFQRYDVVEQNYIFAGWANFRSVWAFVTSSLFFTCLKNSLLSFLFVQLMSPIVLFFTFFIYKKFVGYRFFKIALFLPTIISTLITVTVYKYFCNIGIPWAVGEIFHKQIGGLLSEPSTQFAAVMFFYMWLSFGTLMLMYLGCMNGISESIVESAKLEGATAMQEFIHITFPMIYPTFATLFYTSIAAIFTNQINLYSIWGADAPTSLWTFGYYMYREVSIAELSQYPYLATLGLIMTIVVAPLTFMFKWALNKIGPSVE